MVELVGDVETVVRSENDITWIVERCFRRLFAVATKTSLAIASDRFDQVQLEIHAANPMIERIGDVKTTLVIERKSATRGWIAAAWHSDLSIQGRTAIASKTSIAGADHGAYGSVRGDSTNALITLVENVEATVRTKHGLGSLVEQGVHSRSPITGKTSTCPTHHKHKASDRIINAQFMVVPSRQNQRTIW